MLTQTRAQESHTTQSDSHTRDLKRAERSQLQSDLDAFLAGGGQIEQVPQHFRADPPRKPENNYGRNSI